MDALLKHFNSWDNDNAGHGRRPLSITVLGQVETKGIAGEIARLPASKAKSALKALAKRIHQPDCQPKPRVWVDAKGVALLDKLAAKLGLTADFKGDPKAPKADYD